MPYIIKLHSSGWGFNWVGHSWITIHSLKGALQESWGTNSREGVAINGGVEMNNEGKVQLTEFISDEQYASAVRCMEAYQNLGSGAWDVLNPCSGFAADVWRAATGEDLQHRNAAGLSTPSKLGDSMTNWADNIQTRPRSRTF